jgi:hypothetical protein
MEIYLDISRLCIETAARKKYEGLIRQYFKAKTFNKEKITLEQKIPALLFFLEKANFPELRNYCNNSASVEIRVVLIVLQDLGDMHVRLNETTFFVGKFRL